MTTITYPDATRNLGKNFLHVPLSNYVLYL